MPGGGARRCVVVGNGRMAVECMKILRQTGAGEVALVLNSVREEPEPSRVLGYCDREGLPCRRVARLNDEAVVAEVEALAPDYILNVNSFAILRERLLGAARIAVLNFHNGPLPRYGGVNVCSWAILNGETEYGVTWHVADAAVDTGDIVEQVAFPLAATTTAYALVIKCLMEGISSFRSVAAQIAADRLERRPQDRAGAGYFGRKDIPFGGEFPLWLGRAELDRYLRALEFGPLPNTWFTPWIDLDGQRFGVRSARVVGPEADPPNGARLAAGADCMVALDLEGAAHGGKHA